MDAASEPDNEYLRFLRGLRAPEDAHGVSISALRHKSDDRSVCESNTCAPCVCVCVHYR